MSYESVERELEAMHEFIEATHDPDYAWIDIYEDEKRKLERENYEQELAEQMRDEELRIAIWTMKR